MATYQSLNQLQETPVIGLLAGVTNPNTTAVQLYSGSTNTVYAGDLIYLYATIGNTIVVEKASASNAGFGFIIFNSKKNHYTAGDSFEVAMVNSVIYLEASTAIKRGHAVEYVPTTSTIKSALYTNPIVGTALDIATAAGQLIRVLTWFEAEESQSSSSSCRSSSSSSSSSRPHSSSSCSSSSSCKSSSSSSSSSSSRSSSSSSSKSSSSSSSSA